MLLIFVIGLSIRASIKLTIIDGATQTVIDFMHQSKVTETRSVKFYASGASISHKVVGDACGEVLPSKMNYLISISDLLLRSPRSARVNMYSPFHYLTSKMK